MGKPLTCQLTAWVFSNTGDSHSKQAKTCARQESASRSVGASTPWLQKSLPVSDLAQWYSACLASTRSQVRFLVPEKDFPAQG